MNIFDSIKNKVNILDVVQEYSTLKKAGSYWKGCCPFHHEKTASFTVSPHKEIFYCFGCHVSGDVISFIARIEQCSQIEAVKHLADRYGIELPASEGASLSSNIQERNHYYTICGVVAQWAHEQLLAHVQIQVYLKSRAISMQSITHYTLGYFPGGLRVMQQLLLYCRKKAILSSDLVNAHIISEGRNVFYSSFEERILFPIKDHLGRFCGFGGRVYKPDDTRSKYYNTRENDFFSKGSLLFGLDSAKAPIQECETVFLVEGYTDCIAMVQAGFLNTVATLGTACTVNHLKQLNRYVHTVYVVYDGDKAGRDAVLRLATICWQVNMELKIVTLPSGCDPASFLTSGGDIQTFIAASQDLFLFYINDIGTLFKVKPLAKKLEGVRALLEALAGVDDDLKRDLLLQEAAKSFDMSIDVLRQELNRMREARPSIMQQPLEQGVLEDAVYGKPIELLEKRLVCVILNNTDLLHEQNAYYLSTYLSRPFGDIVRRLYHIKRSATGDCFRIFFASLNAEQQRYVSELLLAQDSGDDGEQCTVLYEQWQRRQWKFIVEDIKVKLAKATNEGDQESVSQLLKEFALLKQKMVSRGPGNQTEQ
jgi:DNA primase